MSGGKEHGAGLWQVRAVCECGQTFRAPFGSVFHIHMECCPDCGADKDDFSVKTIRWVYPVRGPWWKLWPVIEPGYWQSLKEAQAMSAEGNAS